MRAAPVLAWCLLASSAAFASLSGSFALGYCGWNGKISASTNSH